MEEKILIKGTKTFPAFVIVTDIFFIVSCFVLSSMPYDKVLFVLSLALYAVTLYFLAVTILGLTTKVTVTNKKVLGVSSKFTKADVLIEHIEAVNLVNSYCFTLKTTAGLMYAFEGYKNAPEIVKVIRELLSPETEETENDISALKQYKDLLDSGVITQEEFDAKKKQLLGL